MNGIVYTVTCGRDPDPDLECPLVSAGVTAWTLDAEAAENARLETLERETLEREASASPPYLYRGRKERCFSRPKKTRWRKG